MTWLFIIVGVVCLIALQTLRSALAIEFPTRSVRRSGRPEARHYGGLDLIDETSAALHFLGFDGPEWLETEERSADARMTQVHAVYRHHEKNTVAWVGPTLDATQPGQLLVYYTTALQDGRFAVTQVSDPYFSAVGDPRTPAQTIAPTDRASELSRHLEFVTSQDAAAVSGVSMRDGVVRFAADHLNDMRGRLLARRWLKEIDGTARPTIRFAARLLWHWMTRPVTRNRDSRPIPAARLAFIASVVRRAAARAPAQSTQWLLLLSSALLFVAIGWPIFGADFTLILLAVIVFHEAGHWAAMRAFGYRNPHITLLPLLGGVTIGHETDPSAVKRVWVSLAGPLPGILLGWMLVYAIMSGTDPESLSAGWVLPTAIVLLFVNYLNILPIPPLDGSHVVNALLPPGWIAARVGTIFLGVAVGVYVAYWLDFWPLALIAALQLFAVRRLWNDAALVRRFRGEPPPVGDEDSRIEWLLEKLETAIGAAKDAGKRIRLAREIQGQIELRPMGGVHRTFASLVFLSLVAVPVGLMSFAVLDPLSVEINPESRALAEELDRQESALAARAETMTLEQVGAALAAPDELPAGADGGRIAAAERRLGSPMPAHLAIFYTAMDGLDTLGLLPVDEVRTVDRALFETTGLQYSVYDGALHFYDDDFDETLVPLETAVGWWLIGKDETYGTYVFADPRAAAGEPAIYDLGIDQNALHPDLVTLLRSYWVRNESAALYDAAAERMFQANLEAMQDLTITELMATFPQPGWFERLVLGDAALAKPADPERITEAERRIGYALPDDHRQVIEQPDGYNLLHLLPPGEIVQARLADESSLDVVMTNLEESARAGNTLRPEDLEACWVVAGLRQSAGAGNAAGELYGHIFWCPELGPERRYVSPSHGGFHPTMTSLVRQAAARMSVAW